MKMLSAESNKKSSKVAPSAAGSHATAITEIFTNTKVARAKTTLAEALKALSMIGPPIVGVVVLAAIVISITLRQRRDIYQQAASVQITNTVTDVVEALQKERGMSCVQLTHMRTQPTNTSSIHLTDLRIATNKAIHSIVRWDFLFSHYKGTGARPNLTRMLTDITWHRKKVDQEATTCLQSIKFYTDLTGLLTGLAARAMYDETNSGQFWARVASMEMLLAAQDLFGIKRALGSSFFAHDRFHSVMRQTFDEITGGAMHLLQKANRAFGSKTFAGNNTKVVLTVVEKLDEIIVAGDINWSNITADYYFKVMTEFIELTTVQPQAALRTEVDTTLRNNLAQSELYFVACCTVACVALILCTVTTTYFGVQNQKMQRKVNQKIKELAAERDKTDQLICQMIPRSIASALKQGRVVQPKNFTDVTVFFSDIKGFTTLSAFSSPIQIIQLLNSLYSAMDLVLDRYACYKVETIGDAYMVASGCPKTNGKDHSNEICTMALDMLGEVAHVPIEHMPGEQLLMRIGIHTGPVAAGIVGNKMPRYCLFGDTVNTASRMESTGEPMCIHISEDTAKHLHTHHKAIFTIQRRGEQEIKGKGKMTTHWLLSKKDFSRKVDLEVAQFMTVNAKYDKMNQNIWEMAPELKSMFETDVL